MKKDFITIFVHGTLPPAPSLNIPFIHNFFYCPPGLTSAFTAEPTLHLTKIAQTLYEHYPETYPLEQFYFFGWSGKLSIEARKEAAHNLNDQLKALSDHHTHGAIRPFIRLISHSHGGNVALYLGQETENLYSIDELIMLACPVQNETAQNINQSLFKNVYSFYSQKDLLQILDPQGVYTFLESLKKHGLEFTIGHLQEIGPLFSQRRFPDESPVKQMHIKHPHREFLHIEFLLLTFISALPKLVARLRETTLSHQENTYLFKDEPN